MQIESTSAELFARATRWEIVYIAAIVVMVSLTAVVQIPALDPYHDLLTAVFFVSLGLIALGMIQNGRFVAAARAKRTKEQKG